jgi:hypothetical protein
MRQQPTNPNPGLARVSDATRVASVYHTSDSLVRDNTVKIKKDSLLQVSSLDAEATPPAFCYIHKSSQSHATLVYVQTPM